MKLYRVNVRLATGAKIEYTTSVTTLRRAVNGAWKRYPKAVEVEAEVIS